VQLQYDFHKSNLSIIKDRWGLKKASKDVLYTKFNLFEKIDCVSIDSSTLLEGIQQFDTRRNILIKNVIQKYIKIRLFHEVRKTNDVPS